jgi:large subunit ribosomal protein L14
MIQKETYLRVVDNSGAKTAACIHIYGGYRKRYAKVGDSILVAIKSTKKKKPEDLKIKKGDMSKALVVSTKNVNANEYGKIKFSKNTIILFDNQNKYLGTRLFVPMLESFRFTKYLKLMSMSSGFIY